MKTVLSKRRATSLAFINDDCVHAMDQMPNQSVDVAVLSCPYNLGIKYDVYDDKRSMNDYLCWCSQWLGALARVLSVHGSIFLNVGWKSTQPDIAERVLLVAQTYGLELQNKLAWVKSISIPVKTKKDVIKEAAAHAGLDKKATRSLVRSFAELEGNGIMRTFGHIKTQKSQRFVNDSYEMIYHLTLSNDVEIDRLGFGVPFEDKTNINRFGAAGRPDVRCRGNTWFLPYPTIQARRPHPAPFPLALPEACIKLHGVSRAKHVLDPFGGSGTTAEACVALGVERCTSIELSAKYHKMSVARIRGLA